MNVSLNNIDTTKGIVKLEIVKDDYADQVEKNLRNFRQKANVPGFRRGMVPMGMVKKMYGKQVLADEINKLVSEKLYGYIHDNKLNILGEPLPNTTEQQPIDFDTQDTFEFFFDVALAPQFEINLSKDDKLTYYKVNIDEEMVEQHMDAYTANFGSYDQVEEAEEKDLIKGVLAELENGSPKEGGIVVEDAVLMPAYIKDEEEKAKFIGAKVNSVIVFNPHKAYEGNDAELASLLKISKEAVAEHTGDFSFEIREITRHKKAELNQELFDKLFGEGVVNSVEEFKDRIRTLLAEQLTPQSDFKFLLDARDVLVEKAGELKFADDLLKRWLLFKNEKNTPEKLEEEYPKIINDLKYQLVKEYLLKENNLDINDDDVKNFARRATQAQFAQYGMLSVPEDILANYTNEMLKNKQNLQNILDRAIEEKLATWLKEQVELDVKEVSTEEFSKLF